MGKAEKLKFSVADMENKRTHYICMLEVNVISGLSPP